MYDLSSHYKFVIVSNLVNSSTVAQLTTSITESTKHSMGKMAVGSVRTKGPEPYQRSLRRRKLFSPSLSLMIFIIILNSLSGTKFGRSASLPVLGLGLSVKPQCCYGKAKCFSKLTLCFAAVNSTNQWVFVKHWLLQITKTIETSYSRPLLVSKSW